MRSLEEDARGPWGRQGPAPCSPLAEVVAQHATSTTEICRRAAELNAPLAKARFVGDLTLRFREAQNGAVKVTVEVSTKP